VGCEDMKDVEVTLHGKIFLEIQRILARMSLRSGLKFYSIVVGFIGTFFSFFWITFQVYVVMQTLPDQVKD